jgi:predicted small lipoprotein YifL
MRKFLFLIPVFIVMGTFTSCGKKGPILPPVPKIPQKIKEIQAIQRGEKIILMWNNPTAYLDGTPLSTLSEVSIWLHASPLEESTAMDSAVAKRFLGRARQRDSFKKEEFSKIANNEMNTPFAFKYIYILSGSAAFSRRHVFGIKVKDKRGRMSEFSDLRVIDPVMLSMPPQGLRASAFRDRIEIQWNPPNENIDRSSPPNYKGYNIYRSEGGGYQLLNSALVNGNKFRDRSVLIGSNYQYIVRASATRKPPFLESDDSQAVEVIYKDSFPPAVPTGLMTVAGESFIALSWEIPQDPDLAGFRVWRIAEEEEDFTLLTPDPIWENAYSDSRIEKNITYWYAVTALDKSGNESQRSETVSEIIKEGPS